MSERRFRLCLISEDLALPVDEGIKKLVRETSRPLRDLTDLLTIATGSEGDLPSDVVGVPTNKLFLSPRLAAEVRRFRPDCIVYVPWAAATRNAFVRCGILRLYAPRARRIMISLQPRPYDGLTQRLLPRLSPHIILVQSPATRDQLAMLGCPVALIPSGVDLAAFHPVSAEERRALRRQYGVPEDAYVVLHVGHFKRERNVLLLNRLRSETGFHTVMVGSSAIGAVPLAQQREVADELRRGGTQVIDHYVERIGDIYALADCYLFPGRTALAAIEMPLSVLEAMACGLPVVTTRFGPLPHWFEGAPGVTFADSDADLVAAVRLQQKQPSPDPTTIRAQVEPFSWPAVARTLLDFARGHTPPATASTSPTLSPDIERITPCAS